MRKLHLVEALVGIGEEPRGRAHCHSAWNLINQIHHLPSCVDHQPEKAPDDMLQQAHSLLFN